MIKLNFVLILSNKLPTVSEHLNPRIKINYIYINNKQLRYRLASDTNINTKKRVSKKGILVTALIVAGIIGASFIVYLIP